MRQRGHCFLKPQSIDHRIGRVQHSRTEVAHVDARTESSSGAGDHDNMNRRVDSQSSQRLLELGEHYFVDCVQALWAVEAQHRDTVARSLDADASGTLKPAR